MSERAPPRRRPPSPGALAHLRPQARPAAGARAARAHVDVVRIRPVCAASAAQTPAAWPVAIAIGVTRYEDCASCGRRCSGPRRAAGAGRAGAGGAAGCRTAARRSRVSTVPLALRVMGVDRRRAASDRVVEGPPPQDVCARQHVPARIRRVSWTPIVKRTSRVKTVASTLGSSAGAARARPSGSPRRFSPS
jgi:hypothetical protein